MTQLGEGERRVHGDTLSGYPRHGVGLPLDPSAVRETNAARRADGGASRASRVVTIWLRVFITLAAQCGLICDSSCVLNWVSSRARTVQEPYTFVSTMSGWILLPT